MELAELFRGTWTQWLLQQTFMKMKSIELLLIVSLVIICYVSRLMSDLNRKGGERMVTMMMYLSNVEEGGNTVFPQLQLAVRPQQGALLFWVNVKADGTFDTRACHLGQ